jgi:hypothetical protein
VGSRKPQRMTPPPKLQSALYQAEVGSPDGTEGQPVSGQCTLLLAWLSVCLVAQRLCDLGVVSQPS